MDSQFEKEFFQRLALEKMRSRRSLREGNNESNKEILSIKAKTSRGGKFTATLSRYELDSYTNSTLKHIYRHQHRAGKLFITEPEIRRHLSSNARLFLSFILTELEDMEAITRFEVRGKLVYKVHQKRVEETERKIAEINKTQVNMMAQVAIKEEQETVENEEIQELPKRELTDDDIFNATQDYVQKRPIIRGVEDVAKPKKEITDENDPPIVF